MGFLKFLKREKKESLDDLDLPPAPPPLEGAETELGTTDFGEDLPELPEFPELEKISAPEQAEFEVPEEEKLPELGEEAPEFPTFPEMEEKHAPTQTFSSFPMSKPVPMPTMPSAPQPMQEPEQGAREEPRFMPLNDYPKMERRLFSQEKRILRERPSGKTIYVRVDKFKATLGSINMVRSDLRKSEEALMKLEKIKNSKDKSFDRVKSSLDDLQKKLIFVDKTLFKGD